MDLMVLLAEYKTAACCICSKAGRFRQLIYGDVGDAANGSICGYCDNHRNRNKLHRLPQVVPPLLQAHL